MLLRKRVVHQMNKFEQVSSDHHQMSDVLGGGSSLMSGLMSVGAGGKPRSDEGKGEEDLPQGVTSGDGNPE